MLYIYFIYQLDVCYKSKSKNKVQSRENIKLDIRKHTNIHINGHMSILARVRSLLSMFILVYLHVRSYDFIDLLSIILSVNHIDYILRLKYLSGLQNILSKHEYFRKL